MVKKFPELLTEYLESTQSHAIDHQFRYDPREEVRTPWQLDSPIGGVTDQVMPGLIRHYTDRALLLTTNRCAAHCRYCFRRTSPHRSFSLDDQSLLNIVSYLKDHQEVKELLLSGGDPLTLPLQRLQHILSILREGRRDILFRYCTRLPIVDPRAMTDELIELLVSQGPAVMVLHLNHVDELSPSVKDTLQRLQAAGLELWSQTVLLKGVNDTTQALADLFSEIALLGIHAHYLFQLDLAPGIDHFRVDLLEGIRLVRAVASELPESMVPTYALDVPGVGGKINLLASKVHKKEDTYEVSLGETTFTYPL